MIGIGGLWETLTYWLDGGPPPRPRQSPAAGLVMHSLDRDPALMVRREGAPLRALRDAKRSYVRTIKS